MMPVQACRYIMYSCTHAWGRDTAARMRTSTLQHKHHFRMRHLRHDGLLRPSNVPFVPRPLMPPAPATFPGSRPPIACAALQLPYDSIPYHNTPAPTHLAQRPSRSSPGSSGSSSSSDSSSRSSGPPTRPLASLVGAWGLAAVRLCGRHDRTFPRLLPRGGL